MCITSNLPIISVPQFSNHESERKNTNPFNFLAKKRNSVLPNSLSKVVTFLAQPTHLVAIFSSFKGHKAAMIVCSL